MTNTTMQDGVKTGALHLFVAFDWGDQIDLDRARGLCASEEHALPRKPRTPSSIAYCPPPLRAKRPPTTFTVASIGTVSADVDVTIFDFGAVSVALHVPLNASATTLAEFAGSLADSKPLIDAVRAAVEPLFAVLKPAIHHPHWSSIEEEYFVFQFSSSTESAVDDLLETRRPWLAGLVRLERNAMSDGEVAESLKHRINYTPRDLFVPDWAAAVVIDDDCDELLDVIAFANVQLLEFRHIDARLAQRLNDSYGLLHQLARSWLPFWRTHARTLRAVGELKIEANVMLERSGSTLKLVGDPYIARAYHLLATRLHLDDWGQNVRQSLSVLEGTYQVLSNQTAIYRAEVLEIAIVLLILFEIVVSLVGR